MRFFLCLALIACLFAEEPRILEKNAYTSEVASLPVKDKEGNEKGQISYISYTQEGHQRPITFVFNGGPGSSSVWLHLGTFGPRRILSPEEGQSVTPPYQIIDNDESILDLTDLVFIDPIGTGLSQAKTAEDAKAFYDIKGDIESVGNFIRDFLTAKKRWNSPLYIAGESYGTSRACGLSHYLQSEHGIYLNGLILISCLLDFQTIFFDGSNNPLPYFLYFPTYVATAWHHGRYRPDATLEEVVQDARNFAYKNYASFLFRPSLVEKEAFFEQLATMTGLPLEVVQREEGKIQDVSYLTSFFPAEKKTLGHFDSRSTGSYIYPHLASFNQDPSINSTMGVFSTAFHDYLHHELDCPSSYKIFSMEANEQWNFHTEMPFGYPNFATALQQALIENPELKIFVGSGYFDLATPFAATEYCLEQLRIKNLQSEHYEGGHMFYLNPSARKKFKEDLKQFYANWNHRSDGTSR